MACTLIPIESIADFLVRPTACDYYFWLKILLTIMLLVGWGIYREEKKRVGQGDLLSAFAVSSLSISILAIFGTLITGDTGTLSGIPMIQSQILLILFAISLPLLLIWIFKDRQ